MVANTHAQHWNNNKAEQTASLPGFVEFVRNDVGCGGWRKGGALMDPPQSNKASAKPEAVSIVKQLNNGDFIFTICTIEALSQLQTPHDCVALGGEIYV